MPLQATSGAASYDAFGGGVAAVPNYIEDVFSTWLYTGNGSTQTITNGIDSAGEGGLTWIKSRSAAYHCLFDTNRGANNVLWSNTTNAQVTYPSPYALTAFNSNGFSLNAEPDVNQSSVNYASWTFRKQPKFFDCVTFTGDGSGSQFVNHNLQSSYGFIVIKRTDSTSDWFVLAKESSADVYWQLKLNSTAAYTGLFGADPNTNTGFFPSSVIGAAAVNGGTYVAYIFAHDAGGFGLTGTDNVISCGSYTALGSGNGQTINLGYEPQWVLVKSASAVNGWFLFDTMRGMSLTESKGLVANNANAESTLSPQIVPNATGFQSFYSNVAGESHIYIAIRRGPMKVPTDATKVFSPIARTGTGAAATVTGLSFPPDMALTKRRNGATASVLLDRLRGAPVALRTSSTAAEVNDPTFATSFNMNGITFGNEVGVNGSTFTYANWFFGRAPGFFDEVCNGSGADAQMLLNHNLGVAPEMIIKKLRNGNANWNTWASGIPFGDILDGPNTTGASYTNGSLGNSTPPSATQFQTYQQTGLNYVYYLFATCPGVSKVFSFTGNGSTQTIDCGFTGGARFVLLKASSATGGWYVYDTARGMTVLTDPYLQLNSTAAETATLGSVTTVSTGFAVNEAITTGVNTNGVTYVGIAIS